MPRSGFPSQPEKGRVRVLLALLSSILFLAGCAGSTTSTARPPTTPTAVATLLPTATVAVPPAPTGTAPPTGTPMPAGFSTFRSSDGVYSLDFPSTWGTRPLLAQGISIQLFGSLDGTTIFAVLPIKPAVAPEKYPTIISTFLGAEGIGGSGVRIFPVPTTLTLNGMTWTRLTATFTLQSTPESLIGYIAPHGSVTFALLFFAPDAQLASVDTKDFEPMAQSFTFLN